MAKAVVLDTSAAIALLADEPGAGRVAEILNGASARPVYLSFMTRMEILYRVTAERGEETAGNALRFLDAAGVDWVSCEPAILTEAARIKSRGGLSVADAWIAATAVVRDAVLIHADPEFARVSHVAQERLRR